MSKTKQEQPKNQHGECSICVERINKSTHKRVECSSCDNICCRKCVQTYLLGTSEMPHCMHCKTEWTNEYLSTLTTKQFHNSEYRKYRAGLALDREKGLLAITQPIVEKNF